MARRRYGRRRYYDYYERFPPASKPREAKGGIKAQSRHGAIGESWWARRWIEVLEASDIGARLGRGKSYARKGQVLTIDVQKGRIEATVQGSRSTPYRLEIEVAAIPAVKWRKIVKRLAAQALYAVRLLAGELPEEIEAVFDEAGANLFPRPARDLEPGAGKDVQSDCSCPDWSNPCKHIAAVFYLMAEELDRDPFLLFKLRGMERKKLLEAIAKVGPAETKPPSRAAKAAESATPTEGEPADKADSAAETKRTRKTKRPAKAELAPATRRKPKSEPASEPKPASETEPASKTKRAPKTKRALKIEPVLEAKPEPSAAQPLPADPEAFWGKQDVELASKDEARIPPVAAALPKRLGNLPFWRGEERFLEAMDEIYAQASPAGIEVLLEGEGQ